mgnify:CR=1 FL=1
MDSIQCQKEIKVDKKIEDINDIDLKVRKQKVKEKLKNNNLTSEQIFELLSYDNTNEELISRYIFSLDNDKKTEKEIIDYSNFLSVSEMRRIQAEKFGRNLGLRNFSFKDFFFKFLFGLNNINVTSFNSEISKLRLAIIHRKTNNQPFDIDNLEALYYNLCCILSSQIDNNNNKKEQYFKNLKLFLSNLKILKEYYKKNKDNKDDDITYENEKKDFNKFLTIIFAVLNIDYDNYNELYQLCEVFEPPSDEDKQLLITIAKKEIKKKFGEETANEFIEKITKNDNYFTLKYNVFKANKIEISEESYLYDYIIKNNIYKKYEKEIIRLMKIIYKSDLIKQMVKTLYIKDKKKDFYFFDGENSIEDFWNNVILFVPYKMKRISGFNYRDISKIFISIYKIRHFDTDLEDEIFTLGAFFRTIFHESLGHFIYSYLFFMFYANLKTNKDYYRSPRMENQLKDLNGEYYIESIGNELAKLYISINNDIIINEKVEKFSDKHYEILEKKLIEKFEEILGSEYADKLAKKLIENEKEKEKDNTNVIFEENDNDIIQEIEEKSNINEPNVDEDTIIMKKSKEIIDILLKCISEEFSQYIEELTNKQEKYKAQESGNIIEFLLFNDFGQYLTLKECMFLLDEENYKNTNMFKFRTEYKNLPAKNNKQFLDKYKDGNKIFGKKLFAEYVSLYESDVNVAYDFTVPQSFRENCDNNLSKKFETFQCFFMRAFDNDYSEEN